MVPIPRGSTAYKVAARWSAPKGELASDRHDEPQPVQSRHQLTRGVDRCRPLDRVSPELPRTRERNIDVELDIESPIQARQVPRAHPIRPLQVRRAMPAGVVQPQHDDPRAARPGLARKK